jgi:hypothetical protein
MEIEDTTYDEASRHLCKRIKAPLLHYLMQLDDTHVNFKSFLDSVLTLPGKKERICDAVARMTNLDKGGVPFAAIIEFQTEPDPNMLGRLLVAGGICWLTVKPADLPGDRYELCAIVVNLSGVGNCGCATIIGTSEWTLKPFEWNLASLDAGVVLAQIIAGKAPVELLAWIPLMKNGCHPDNMKTWLEIATSEPDSDRRGDFALAVVFAELVGQQELWRKVVENLKMKESTVVRQWKDEAHREGKREGKIEGKIEGKAELLILALEERFGPLAEELASRIRASTDSEQLDRWMRSAVAVTVSTLEQFRQKAGI